MFCTDNVCSYIPPQTQHYTKFLYHLEDRLAIDPNIKAFYIYRDKTRRLVVNITLVPNYKLTRALYELVADSRYLLDLAVNVQHFPRAYLHVSTHDYTDISEFPDFEVKKQ